MHEIRKARTKPGIESSQIASSARTEGTGSSSRPLRVIEGKALVLWDPKRPGRKLDAIDTDQITPAADCVSESLEALDEKWKEGAFRYLVPEFRRRVHAGE